MAKTSTNINIDTTVKAEAQELFNSLGLDLSTAIGLFLRQAVREQRIPFEIRAYTPNEETNAAIREVRQMKRHPEQFPGYTDVDQMMEELLK